MAFIGGRPATLLPKELSISVFFIGFDKNNWGTPLGSCIIGRLAFLARKLLYTKIRALSDKNCSVAIGRPNKKTALKSGVFVWITSFYIQIFYLYSRNKTCNIKRIILHLLVHKSNQNMNQRKRKKWILFRRPKVKSEKPLLPPPFNQLLDLLPFSHSSIFYVNSACRSPQFGSLQFLRNPQQFCKSSAIMLRIQLVQT